MRAFAAAVDLGYRHLETDVQATADGVLVAFHDERLDRITDRQGSISALPFAEVRAARIGADETIPTLDEVLGSWPEICFNIDPKHDAAVEPLIQLLRRHDAFTRVCVGSFSGARVARLRNALGPGLCTAATPQEILRLRLASLGLPVGEILAQCLQVPQRRGPLPIVDRRFLAAAGRRGLQVHVWIVDTPGEMHRLLDLGVDGLITDRPALLKRVLCTRGQWFGRD